MASSGEPKPPITSPSQKPVAAMPLYDEFSLCSQHTVDVRLLVTAKQDNAARYSNGPVRILSNWNINMQTLRQNIPSTPVEGRFEIIVVVSDSRRGTSILNCLLVVIFEVFCPHSKCLDSHSKCAGGSLRKQQRSSIFKCLLYPEDVWLVP